VEILLFWLPGRVAGPEVGPGRKWQGLGPALSIASAATAIRFNPNLHPRSDKMYLFFDNIVYINRKKNR